MTGKNEPAGAGSSELLAPYGRAWGKLIGAYEARIEQLDDAELAALIVACDTGRWSHELKGNDYFSSTEVQRAALAESNRRKRR